MKRAKRCSTRHGVWSCALPLLAVSVVAAADPSAEPAQPIRLAAEDSPSRASRADTPPLTMETLSEVIVTGTNIRNVPETFAPVHSASREDLDRAGLGRVTDYIARLPQNFAGAPGTTPDQNSMGAVAINLRGLGNEATLTLLNGRRLAPSGLAGDLSDISAIPTAALERVDVLTDGASAIYGSDAIAGVANFVLRRDFNGAETRLRVGSGDGGSAQEIQAAQTVGISGERGRMLLSYEYSVQDELDANDRDFTREMSDPNEIWPYSRRHSAVFSGALNIGSRAEVFSDLYYNRRDSHQVFQLFDTRVEDGEVKQYGGTIGAFMDFADDWRVEVSASQAKNEFYDEQLIDPHPPIYIGLFQESETRVRSIDAKLDGSLFALPGGNARGVFGAQFRDEKHDGGADFFNESGAAIGSAQAVAHTSREVKTLFTEFFLPLVSEQNARPGLRELTVSLAGRYEDYSDFGDTFNPKYGLRWSPVEGLTLRGTYGTSFRAPRLQQLVDQVSTFIIADYIDPEAPGGMSVAAWVSGSTSDLDAEESESWTVGFDFEPAFASGLKLQGTYFKIDYHGRIAIPQPVLSGLNLHSFPLPPQRGVSQAELNALLSSAIFPLINFTMTPVGSQSGLEDVTVLLDSRNTNTSRSKVSGVDFAAIYSFAGAGSDWQLSLDGTYLLEAEDQFSVITPAVPKLNTVGNPPDLRARGGASWSRDAMSAGLYVNYVDGYRDIAPLAGPQPIASWTTVDITYRYDFGARHTRGLLSGFELIVSALNVLDRDPPRIALTVAPGSAARQIPYDVANADPLGRMLAVQFNKSW